MVQVKELCQVADILSRGLSVKERLLMRWRPRICPFHVLLGHIPEGSSVLAIGCGSGLWLFLLAHFGRIAKGIGTDVRRDKIELANKLKRPRDKLEFVQVNSPEAWPRNVCDCVTLIDVLHHVPQEKQQDFIQAIDMTGTARIVLKEMDPEAKFKSMMNTLHDLVLSRQLSNYTKKETVVRWLEQMGFEIHEMGRHEMVWYAHYYLVAEKKRK